MNTGFINERKRALNLTNQKIAEQTGITLSTLDKITSGVNTNPKLDTMKALARVLKCSIDDFTDESRQSLDNDEISLIVRYRAMDERSKKFVRMVIDYELGRVMPQQTQGQSQEDKKDTAWANSKVNPEMGIDEREGNVQAQHK